MTEKSRSAPLPAKGGSYVVDKAGRLDRRAHTAGPLDPDHESRAVGNRQLAIGEATREPGSDERADPAAGRTKRTERGGR